MALGVPGETVDDIPAALTMPATVAPGQSSGATLKPMPLMIPRFRRRSLACVKFEHEALFLQNPPTADPTMHSGGKGRRICR